MVVEEVLGEMLELREWWLLRRGGAQEEGERPRVTEANTNTRYCSNKHQECWASVLAAWLGESYHNHLQIHMLLMEYDDISTIIYAYDTLRCYSCACCCRRI